MILKHLLLALSAHSFTGVLAEQADHHVDHPEDFTLEKNKFQVEDEYQKNSVGSIPNTQQVIEDTTGFISGDSYVEAITDASSLEEQEEQTQQDGKEEDEEEDLHLYEKSNHYLSDFITIQNTLYPYQESLDITTLPRNHILTSFDFHITSTPVNTTSSLSDYSNYNIFPRSLSPVLSSTSAKELHLRFTQGKWDEELWGEIPNHGSNAGGIGVEVWAAIEAPSKKEAFGKWIKLVNSLSGLFCASLNFIDSSNTISPVRSFNVSNGGFINNDESQFLFRAALPSEPVCTENLTPFVKFLPTRGKSGLSSLLDGHRIFESEWHTMSIDIVEKCEGDICHYDLQQKIDSVVDLQRVLRRKIQGSIPKPIKGEDLKCDISKEPNLFRCFPLDVPSEISFKLSDVFGRKVKGGSLISEKSTKVCFKTGKSWSVYLEVEDSHFGTNGNCFDLTENKDYDLYVTSEDTTDILPITQSQISVSRSLNGYGQDKGGSRTVFKNKSALPIRLIYLETLPWFMRSYLHTLKVMGAPAKEVIQSIYYLPEIDRQRPTHYEFELIIPSNSTIAISYQFDKSLLLYAEYPPDANHGFSLEPGVVITIPDDDNTTGKSYQMRTSPGLLTLPTPDFSMPYNVIILTSTLMAFAFGSFFNLLTKRVMNEDDVEFLNLQTGPKAVFNKKIENIKALLLGKGKSSNTISGTDSTIIVLESTKDESKTPC